MIENDTWYKCTVCGAEGRVGRCCGLETRIPLNKLAKIEQGKINAGKKTPKDQTFLLAVLFIALIFLAILLSLCPEQP